jgi:hypothetical protein
LYLLCHAAMFYKDKELNVSTAHIVFVTSIGL